MVEPLALVPSPRAVQQHSVVVGLCHLEHPQERQPAVLLVATVATEIHGGVFAIAKDELTVLHHDLATVGACVEQDVGHDAEIAAPNATRSQFDPSETARHGLPESPFDT